MNNNTLERKICINLDELVPGMIIAQTLSNQYGATIIYDRTVLTPVLIHKLQNLSYDRIYVYDISEKEIDENTNRFSVSYEQSQSMVKDMLKDVGDGRPLDMQKVRSVSTLLMGRIDTSRDVIDAISQVRTTDEYTYTHCINVSLICSLMGRWLKLDDISIKLLTYSGLLHDIGKSKISNSILEKPGKLSEKEFEIIKKHPALGYKILEKIPSLNKNVLMGVLMHHEREDGSGYPLGAKNQQIHYFAKIVALSDIYDAMTSDRVYHAKQSPFSVLEMFENNSFGLLEPRYIMVLLSNIANYYIGDLVRLSSDEVGEIIYINPHHVSRPLVRIDNSYVDLYQEPSLKIIELL